MNGQARDPAQWIEIGEVGNMGEADHRHRGHPFRIHRNGSGAFDDHRIFGIDADVVIPGQHAEYRQPGSFFDPLHPVREEPQISPKPVDDESGHPVAEVSGKAVQGTHQLGEDAAAVNVSHQNYRGIGVFGHGKVDDIVGQEVHFGTGAGAFHHHQVVFRSQTVKGGVGGLHQTCLLLMIIYGRLVADGFAQKYHLRAHVTGGFEQDGVHVHMGDDSGSLGLNDLSPTHLQPFRGDP